jgi:hypothetical protein
METFAIRIGVSARFLDNYHGITSGGPECENRQRPHEQLMHAEMRLRDAKTPYDLVDVITSLKRAVNERVAQLIASYLPGGKKTSKGTYDDLVKLGLIRPLFSQELSVIRAKSEHQYAPPTREECERYAEFVWYFLRSTDVPTAQVPDTVHFYDDDDEKCGVQLSREEGSWEHFDIAGSFRVADIHIGIEPSDIIVCYSSPVDAVSFWDKLAQSRPVLPVRIHGSVEGPDMIVRRIHRIFATVVN